MSAHFTHCWLMQPLPAHPDTAADILCQKRKIALASDGKIRKDCQDMHVVSWGKIRATMSLKEFVLSAFREQGGSSKHVGFLNQTLSETWKTVQRAQLFATYPRSVLRNRDVVKKTKQQLRWRGLSWSISSMFCLRDQLLFISAPPTKDAG